MFLSDGVRFGSHVAQLPLEVDVTTFPDESLDAITGRGNVEQSFSLHFSQCSDGELNCNLLSYMLDFSLLMLLVNPTIF